MSEQKDKFKAFIWYRLLFQLVFWGMWLVFPAIMISNMVGTETIEWRFIVLGIILVPLFYLNSNYFIPVILEKKGLGQFLLTLLIASIFFYFIHFLVDGLFLDGSVNPPRRGPEGRRGMMGHRRYMKSMFPVLTITAISTVYGLINFFIRHEQEQQEESQERKQAELSLLRSQVSPHFLFNTLNSVLYLIRVKSSRAEELVLKLSDILKYMIYETGNNEVSLNLEVEYLNNYIELQTIRFGDDVNIEYSAEGDFNQYVIEPMLIIPFVENAFKHGSSATHDPEIHIAIKMENEEMELNVSNRFQGTNKKMDSHGGIGLQNVEKRLKLLYPETATLKVTKNEDWYKVKLIIKLHKHG